MSTPPRIVLASRRSVEQKVWQASQLEFEDVIAQVDDVDWCLPRPPAGGRVGHLASRVGHDRHAELGAGIEQGKRVVT